MPEVLDEHNSYWVDCWQCDGEGQLFSCFDGCCECADEGCDDCARDCDICKGNGGYRIHNSIPDNT